MVTVDIKVTATPWAGSLQGHIEKPTLAFSHTPTHHSEFPVYLTCMFLDTENVQRVRVRVRNQTCSLLSEAAALTTAPPCCPKAKPSKHLLSPLYPGIQCHWGLLERLLAVTGATCRLHTERSQPRNRTCNLQAAALCHSAAPYTKPKNANEFFVCLMI